MNPITEQLFAHQDLPYRDFQARLLPTINPDHIIGVRMPVVRRLAREWAGSAEMQGFLQALPHEYQEENNLHGCWIMNLKDYDACMEALQKFLPFVDNWATCDLLSPGVFRKHLPELLCEIEKWLASEREYTVRFGVGMLMKFYLDEAFEPRYLEWAASVQSEAYYVNMMLAWYFATALAKQYREALPYLEEARLDKWVHNKTIQKAIESYRILAEQKEALRKLRRA